jgi:hypothetical protein
MNFYLVLSREVCPRSSRPHGRSMKHPLGVLHTMAVSWEDKVILAIELVGSKSLSIGPSY